MRRTLFFVRDLSPLRSIYLYIYIYICIYVCIYAYLNIYIHTHTHTYIYIYIHIYIYIYIYTYKYIYIYIYIYIYMCVCVYMYIYVCVCMYMYIDICIYLQIYLDMRRCTLRRPLLFVPDLRSLMSVYLSLALTRYCFTSKLYCGSQSSFYTPPHLQSLPYCNTIARPLRNIRPPTDPHCVCHTPCTVGDGNIV